MWSYNHTSELYHHGIKGMKWGKRRFQNKDGSLTPAGRERYDDDGGSSSRRSAATKGRSDTKTNTSTDNQRKGLSDKQKTALKVGAAAAGTALAAYGAYKLNQYVKTKNCQIAAKNGLEFAAKSHQMSVSAFLKTSGDFGAGSDSWTRTITTSGKDIALDRARNASNDSFAKAAKNVINYKKSGGDLGSLKGVDFYRDVEDYVTKFGKGK